VLVRDRQDSKYTDGRTRTNRGWIVTNGFSDIADSIEYIRKATAVIDSAWRQMHHGEACAHTVMALDEASSALHRAMIALDVLVAGNPQNAAEVGP
jgi:hypothetical protein